MDGPSHYREAERLIANAKTANVNRDASAFYLAQAQVHAILALAMATANPLASGWQDTAQVTR